MAHPAAASATIRMYGAFFEMFAAGCPMRWWIHEPREQKLWQQKSVPSSSRIRTHADRCTLRGSLKNVKVHRLGIGKSLWFNQLSRNPGMFQQVWPSIRFTVDVTTWWQKLGQSRCHVETRREFSFQVATRFFWTALSFYLPYKPCSNGLQGVCIMVEFQTDKMSSPSLCSVRAGQQS